MLVNVGGYISVCFSVRQTGTMLQFLTTWLHLLVRNSPQQISESQKPTLVFILLYLYQPNCQNMYNLLNPNSVPNYTPQKTGTPNTYNEILSWCYYSLRKFLQLKKKTNQKQRRRCSHKNLFKPHILLVVVNKPEQEESSVTPLPSPQTTTSLWKFL